MQDEFEVKIEDLINGSNALVKVKCDNCICNKELEIIWYSYNKNIKEDGKYYCHKCSLALYATQNRTKIALKNGRSFEQCCVENKKQDILNRWDDELNDCKPSEISRGNRTKKYWFKCPKGIHKSELKDVSNFCHGHDGVMDCKACNSFAQYGINIIGNDFLIKYWDSIKNKASPWDKSHGSNNKKVWIKCQENEDHESYSISPNDFIRGRRCPICNDSKGEAKIKEVCNLYNIYYGSQYIFPDLIGERRWPLKFDVPVFCDIEKTKLKYLIEYDGIQHFQWQKSMMTKKQFERLQRHDKLKDEYCKLHNIKLIRIKYDQFDKIEEIIKYI